GELRREELAQAIEQRVGARAVLRRRGLVEEERASGIRACAHQGERQQQSLAFAARERRDRGEGVEEAAADGIVAETAEEVPEHAVAARRARSREARDVAHGE